MAANSNWVARGALASFERRTPLAANVRHRLPTFHPSGKGLTAQVCHCHNLQGKAVVYSAGTYVQELLTVVL
jgi:hypothetical protein